MWSERFVCMTCKDQRNPIVHFLSLIVDDKVLKMTNSLLWQLNRIFRRLWIIIVLICQKHILRWRLSRIFWYQRSLKWKRFRSLSLIILLPQHSWILMILNIAKDIWQLEYIDIKWKQSRMKRFRDIRHGKMLQSSDISNIIIAFSAEDNRLFVAIRISILSSMRSWWKDSLEIYHLIDEESSILLSSSMKIQEWLELTMDNLFISRKFSSFRLFLRVINPTHAIDIEIKVQFPSQNLSIIWTNCLW